MSPVPVAGNFLFSAVSIGGVDYGCGLARDGRALCWGNNFRGLLGTGVQGVGTAGVPQAVSGGLTFSMLAAGGSHVCGITTSNEVWCWGAAEYRQLGRDDSLGDALAPVPVTLPAP